MRNKYLVLVNKKSKIRDDWEENIQLVRTKNVWSEDIKIEKETYKQYISLEKALKEDGINIKLDSAYRSVQSQQELWDEWVNVPEKGLAYAKKFMAAPGYSEHHTGLAIDICLEKDGELVYDNDKMFADIETFLKIHAKLADYGFILRYLKGKEETTGYTYEPWHIRYVGSKKIAKEIMENNLTLEEYLTTQK